jgi:hypothetical protein
MPILIICERREARSAWFKDGQEGERARGREGARARKATYRRLGDDLIVDDLGVGVRPAVGPIVDAAKKERAG